MGFLQQEQRARPLLDYTALKSLWPKGAEKKICFIVSGQTVLQFQRAAPKEDTGGYMGSLQV